MERNGTNFKQAEQSIKLSVVLFVILRITALFFFVTNVMLPNLQQAFQNGCVIAKESMTIRTQGDLRPKSLIFSKTILLVLEGTQLRKSSPLLRTQNLPKKRNLSLRRKRRDLKRSSPRIRKRKRRLRSPKMMGETSWDRADLYFHHLC